MFNILNFITESVKELRHKMTWPSYGSLQRFAMLFVVGIVVCACFVGLVNYSLNQISEAWFY